MEDLGTNYAQNNNSAVVGITTVLMVHLWIIIVMLMDTLYSHLEEKKTHMECCYRLWEKVTSVLWTGLDEQPGPERSINKENNNNLGTGNIHHTLLIMLRESEPGRKE